MSRTLDNKEDRDNARRQYWMDVDEDWHGYASSKKQRENPLEKQAAEFGKTIAAGGNINVNAIQNGSSTLQPLSEIGGVSLNGQGPGMQLPEGILDEMEDRFDADLGDVRIHTGRAAHQMNQKLGANAITRGQQIYFNQNKYNPNSLPGKELLAHELTHTLQQKNGASAVQCSPADVDQAVERIKTILGRRAYKRIRPEKAVAAYREIQKLGSTDIEDFYARYAELAANIDWYLPGEFRSSAGFGFHQGIAEEEKGKLKAMLADPATWKDNALLGLVMQMVQSAFSIIEDNGKIEETVVRLDPDIVSLVLGKMDQGNEAILAPYGFANGMYTPLKYMPPKLTRMRGYVGMGMKYWFGTEKKKNKNVVASLFMKKTKPTIEDFSLAQFEEAMGGTSMGVDFTYEKDEKGKPKKDSPDGKLTFNADFEKGTAHMDAKSLPFATINYQGSDYTFRSGKGIFKGVNLEMSWNTNQEIPAAGKLELDMDQFEINDLRMIMNEETYAIGYLSLSGIKVILEQNMGPADQLQTTMALMSRITTDLLDVSSLITYGITQTLYRFTTPATQSEYDNREKDQEGLGTLMKTQFLEGLSFDLYFTDLTLKNFVYIDKDNVKDSFGESLSTEAPAIETISFIQVNEPGKESFIKVDTVGVPRENKQRLYDLKAKLSKATADLATKNKKSEKLKYKGKEDPDLQNEIADKKLEIANLQFEIQKLQPDMAFDLEADLHGLDMDQGKLINKIGTGLVDDYANEVSGFENTQVTQLNFKTRFDQKGITNTKLALNELTIPMLTLGDIHYSASDRSLDLTAKSAVLTNIKASLEIDFTDQDGTRYNSELAALYDEQATAYGALNEESEVNLGNKRVDYDEINRIYAWIDRVERDIIEMKTNFQSGAAEFAIDQELQRMRHEKNLLEQQLNGAYGDLDAFMQPSLANKGNRQAEENKINQKIAQLEGEIAEKNAAIDKKQEELAPYNPVQKLLVKRLDITKVTCAGLQLLFPLKRMALNFSTDQPVELENLFVENLQVENQGGEWKTGPGSGGDKAKTGLSKMTIPTGLVINKQDEQLQDEFRIHMNTMVAEGMSIDLLKDGGIEYELKTLTGSGTYDNMEVNEKDPNDMSERLTYFVLPGSTQQNNQSFLKGSYKDNLLKNTIYIPEIQVPYLNIHADNASVVVPPGGLATILQGIYVDCEVKFNTNKNAENPVESFTIKSFKIDTVTSNGMTMDFGKAHVEIPTEESSVINGLYLNNLQIVSSLVETTDENGDKKVDVKWDRKPVTDADNKQLDLTAGLTSMVLPKGFDVTVGKKLGVEVGRLSSGVLSFTLLSTGGMSYTSENLDLAGKFWQKDKKGKKTKDLGGMIDSNSMSGTFKKEVIGTGDNAKTKITTSHKVSFEKIHLNKINLSDGETTISTLEPGKGAIVENLDADFEIISLSPSVNELKKNKALKDDLTINIRYLNMQKLTVSGLKMTRPVMDKNWKGEKVKAGTQTIQVPEHMPVVFNVLKVTNFNIHQPPTGKITHTGTATLGDQEHKGIDMGGLILNHQNDSKGLLIDLYGFPLTVDKLTYTSHEDGSIDLELEKPDLNAGAADDVSIHKGSKFTWLHKDFLNDAKDIFEADKITLNIDKDGKMTLKLVNPWLRNLSVLNGGMDSTLDGKIQGTLIVEEGEYDFGGKSNEKGWHVYTTSDITLTKIKMENDPLLGSSEKPVVLDTYDIGLSNIVRQDPKYKNSDMEFDFLDKANGTLNLTLSGIAANTINVKDGKIQILETKTAMANLLRDVINQDLEWGGWAMLFFDWVQDYTWIPIWGERGWVNDLFWGLDEGFDDEDRRESREFFANWVRGQVNRMNLSERRHGLYLTVGDVITGNDAIKIAETEFAPNPRGMLDHKTWVKLSDILEYNVNFSSLPEPLNAELPPGWNIDDYPTTEDMFMELYTNSYYWDPMMNGSLNPPNGPRVQAFISTWIGEKLGPWFVKNLEFDVDLHNIDLEKIGGNDPKEKFKYDAPQPNGLSFRLKGSTGNFEASMDDIPAFTYTKIGDDGKKMIVHTNGILMNKFLSQTKEDILPTTEITNDSIVIKGLDVKIQK